MTLGRITDHLLRATALIDDHTPRSLRESHLLAVTGLHITTALLILRHIHHGGRWWW